MPRRAAKIEQTRPCTQNPAAHRFRLIKGSVDDNYIAAGVAVPINTNASQLGGSLIVVAHIIRVFREYSKDPMDTAKKQKKARKMCINHHTSSRRNI